MCWTLAAAVGITWCLAHRQVARASTQRVPPMARGSTTRVPRTVGVPSSSIQALCAVTSEMKTQSLAIDLQNNCTAELTSRISF